MAKKIAAKMLILFTITSSVESYALTCPDLDVIRQVTFSKATKTQTPRFWYVYSPSFSFDNVNWNAKMPIYAGENDSSSTVIQKAQDELRHIVWRNRKPIGEGEDHAQFCYYTSGKDGLHYVEAWTPPQ